MATESSQAISASELIPQIKLLGVATPNRPAQPVQIAAPAINTGLSDAAVGNIDQRINTGFDTVRRGIGTGQQEINKQVSNAIQVSQNTAIERSSVASADSGVGGLVGGIMQLYQVYQGIQTIQAKAEAARIRKQQEAELPLLLEEAQNLAATAPTIIKGEGGYTAYRGQTQELLSRLSHVAYSYDKDGVATPNTALYQQIAGLLYDPADKIITDESKYRTDSRRKAQEISIETQAKTLLLTQQSALSALEVTTDPTKREDILSGLLISTRDGVQALPYEAQQQVISTVLGDILKSNQIGLREKSKLAAQLEGFQKGLEQLNAARQNFVNAGDTADSRAQYRADVLTIDAQNGTDFFKEFGNPTADAEKLQALADRQAEVRKAAQAATDKISPAGLVEWNQQEFGVYAYGLSLPGGNLDTFEQQFVTGYDPRSSLNASKVIGVARDAKKYREWYYGTRANQIKDIDASIAQLNAGTVDKIRGQLASEEGRVQAKNQLDALMAKINAADAFGSTGLQEAYARLLAGLGNIQGNVGSGSNSQVESLTREWVQLRSELVKVEQARRTALQNQTVVNFGVLGQYGFNIDPGLDQANFSKLQKLREQQEKDLFQAAELIRQRREASGAPPPQSNFRNPPLMTVDNGGKQTYLPFAPGTDATITDTIRYREEVGRNHNGIDIGVAAGTPIIAYTSGRVVVRPFDAEGYGNYIDIVATDGKVHRFAHMQGISVKDGQQIKPGDVLGKVGSTGRSSAPHLHWEIRNGETFGAEGRLNPLDVMQGYTAQPRQNRNAVAQTIPPNSVQLTNYFIRNGVLYDARTGKASPNPFTTANPVRNQGQLSNLPRLEAKFGKRFTGSQAVDWGIPDVKAGNDGNANFGYEFLANNPQERLALHRTATELKIPAQWLADVIGYESGFNSTIKNSLGYTGLIQFGAEAAQDLGVTQDQLAKMPFIKQLEYVKRHLQKAGNINSITELGVYIHGGSGRLAALRAGDRSVLNLSDGSVTTGQYIANLGTNGRGYNNPDAPINLQSRGRLSTTPTRTTSQINLTPSNDNRSNFGYATLQQNQPLLTELNKAGNNLGVPAQWLADIAAYNTGSTFVAPDYTSHDMFGAANMLERNGVISAQRFQGLTQQQQLEKLTEYLKPVSSQITSADRLYIATRYGKSELLKYISGDRTRVNEVRSVLRKLGKDVGRQYTSQLFDRRHLTQHNNYISNCAMCQSMSTQAFIPHEVLKDV